MSTSDPTYARVTSRFWPEAKDEGWTNDMTTLGLYLLTCQQRTTEGLYRLPKGYMVEDLPEGWTDGRVTSSLAGLIGKGFVDYDEKARVVFLPKAMKYQRPDNTNQQKAAVRSLKSLPETRLSGPFFEAARVYAKPFHQALVEAFPQGLGKGHTDSPALLYSTPAPTPNGSKPVDNSADQERGCSIEHEEHEPEPPGSANGDGAAASHAATGDNVGTCDTCGRECNMRQRAGTGRSRCGGESWEARQPEEPAASHTPVCDDTGTCDGNPCTAHDFPVSAFAPLRRAMLVSLHPGQQKEVGTKGDLDALLEVYAAHVCAACQAAFGEFERPQLDGMCEQAVVAAVESLKGSQDVVAVMKSRMLRYGLADLIGDRKLEELRRTKRDKRRKGEPRPVHSTLAPEFAEPMSTSEPGKETP